MGRTWKNRAVDLPTNDGERWSRVDGFDYFVSSHGRVASLKSGRLLSPYKRHHGYLHVTLRRDGKSCGMSVHRLVAAAFVGSLSDTQVVNHKDFDTSNNRDTNLEICSQKQNCQHAALAGRVTSGESHWMRQRAPRGERHNGAKLTSDQVISIKHRLKAGERNIDLASEFGVSDTTVANIKTGKTWGHLAA